MIDKNVIIHGNRNKFIVPLGKTGIHATTHVELFDLNIKAGPRSNALVCETSAQLEHIDFELTGKIREFLPTCFIQNRYRPLLRLPTTRCSSKSGCDGYS